MALDAKKSIKKKKLTKGRKLKTVMWTGEGSERINVLSEVDPGNWWTTDMDDNG